MIPAAIASEPFTTPDGIEHNPCQYCGFCERFACEYDAKAQPTNTFIPVAERTGHCDIRCCANVVEILRQDSHVTGVRYVDTLTMKEYIQPAEVVVLSSYVMNNAKLLMVSDIGRRYDPSTGRGTLGKAYCYQITPGATLFFDEPMNLYAGAGALGVCYDDYNADNFDHAKLDFIHGAVISMTQTGKRPIESPPGARILKRPPSTLSIAPWESARKGRPCPTATTIFPWTILTRTPMACPCCA